MFGIVALTSFGAAVFDVRCCFDGVADVAGRFCAFRFNDVEADVVDFVDAMDDADEGRNVFVTFDDAADEFSVARRFGRGGSSAIDGTAALCCVGDGVGVIVFKKEIPKIKNRK